MKNLKIAAKLGLSFGLLVLLALVVNLISINRMDKLSGLTDKMYRHPFAVSNAVLRIDGNIVRIHRTMKDVALSKTPEDIDKAVKIAEGLEKEVMKDFAIVTDRFLGDKNMYLKAQNLFTSWKPIRMEVIDHMAKGERQQAAAITKEKGADHVKKLLASVKALNDFAQNKAISFYKGSQKVKSNTFTMMYLIIAVALATGVLMTIIITKLITRPIIESVNVAEKIAKGDLAVEVPEGRGDETGMLLDAMKRMTESFSGIVIGVKDAANDVAAKSEQLSVQSGQLSDGISEQFSKSQMIASSSEEMSVTVQEIAQSSVDMSNASENTLELAENGARIVEKSVNEVEAIAETVKESAGLMSSLGERSKQIGEIISVIEDIADQTNLLALNAAIEAARAGDAGRGFAVVADEVRKLAERTGGATSEISGMINAIQSEVDKAIVSMDSGTAKVQNGVELSAETGEALQHIVDSVRHLQENINAIASATEEMASVTNQNAQDIDIIANIAGQASDNSGEVAGLAEAMSTLSFGLQESVNKFKLKG